MIINPRCLKDLDCVGSCPEKALEYRWGAPALTRLWSRRAILVSAAVLAAAILVAVRFPGAQEWWAGRFDLLPFGLAVVLLGLVAYGRSGMPARSYHFSLGEELLMAVVFVATLAVYRQLYDAIPFLLTIGLGAAAAYATVVLLRLLARRDVRWIDAALKSGGRLKAPGVLYVVVVGGFVLLSIHSGLVQWHTRAGYTALALARETSGRGSEAPAAEALRANALEHLRWSERFGLFRSERLLSSIAALEMDRGEWDGAERTLRRVIARHPANAEALVRLGRVLIGQGRIPEAQAQLGEALRVRTGAATRKGLDAIHAQANYHVAAAAAASGDVARAEEALREALRLAPDYGRAHYDLGSLQLASGRVEAATPHLRAAARLEPNLAEAHYQLGLAWAMQGRRDEAVAELEWAVALKPGDEQAKQLLARVRSGAGS
jgi:Flp pilus assembly protein TadD